MLNKIIEFSLHNRLLVAVISALILVLGVYSVSNMEVDVFPDLNAPTVVVMTEAHGMAPEEVERLVTYPIETSVNGATHVRRVRSSSTTGFSVVWVEFDWGTDLYLARQITSERLVQLGEMLPEGVGTPTMAPQSSILGEMMIIGLTADSTSLRDLRTFADWTIRPRLLSIGGVAQATVIGGEIKEYRIAVDPARMKHYDVTIDEVLAASRNMNDNANGGIIYEYGNEYIVRGEISTTDVDAIGRAVVKRIGKMPVVLSDVADVVVTDKSPKLGMASVEGNPAVLITVKKQPNTGTIALTENIEAALADLQKNMPADVKMSTNIFKQSHFIESSINNVQRALIEGAIFVIIVLFFFLMNTRTTLISLIAIPLSAIVSLLTLKALGLTINTMSLGGLAIAIGSAHGVYKKKPMLNIERLKEIRKAVDTPLVLHGGSGLSDDDFRNTIREGIAKVNIFTDLCLAGDRATADGNAQGIGYLETRNLKVQYIKEAVKEKIRLFGSEGKA